MKIYTKEPITIEEQISKLKNRGLIINDIEFAENFLFYNNYFRLRGYTFPFQDDNKHFIKPVTFEEITNIYYFDNELRQLVFSTIQLIEISFRTQLAYHYSNEYGKDFYLNSFFFKNTTDFISVIESIITEQKRSQEKFAREHKESYSSFFMPIGKSVELMSFGNLSIMFKNIKEDKIKNKIANCYGLYDVDVLTKGTHCFTIVRNICCHYARLGNRNLFKIRVPKKTLHNFTLIENKTSNRIYSYICCIIYLLNTIQPKHNYIQKVKELMEKCSPFLICGMGFPTDGYKNEYWS